MNRPVSFVYGVCRLWRRERIRYGGGSIYSIVVLYLLDCGVLGCRESQRTPYYTDQLTAAVRAVGSRHRLYQTYI